MARGFVIYADHYNEDIGGVIALHRLCDLLNRQGRKAVIWPQGREPLDWRQPFVSLRRARRYLRALRQEPFRTFSGFNTPIARCRDLVGAIVVYPEVIDGNPLRARRVVRWLLHRPGFHTGRVNFGAGDRFFFFQQAFNDPVLHADADNLLKVIHLRDDVYHEEPGARRQGTCYIVRKGKGRALVHDAVASTRVDGMSHAQMAAEFRRSEMCISYDLHTMYSYFAALCGCDSVVVPEVGVSADVWYPDPRDRYGVAYGFDDLERARATRPLLLEHLRGQEREANDSVRTFVAKCDAYFPA